MPKQKNDDMKDKSNCIDSTNAKRFDKEPTVASHNSYHLGMGYEDAIMKIFFN